MASEVGYSLKGAAEIFIQERYNMPWDQVIVRYQGDAAFVTCMIQVPYFYQSKHLDEVCDWVGEKGKVYFADTFFEMLENRGAVPLHDFSFYGQLGSYFGGKDVLKEGWTWVRKPTEKFQVMAFLGKPSVQRASATATATLNDTKKK